MKHKKALKKALKSINYLLYFIYNGTLQNSVLAKDYKVLEELKIKIEGEYTNEIHKN